MITIKVTLKRTNIDARLLVAKVKSNKYRNSIVYTSVADPDPDPDPVGSGLFGSPGSGSGSGKIPDPDPDPLSTKRPL